MFETFRNAWKTEDLRKRLLYTLLILILFRLGCAIPVPYITSSALESMFTTGSMLTYLNMMSGGAMSRCTIFALGVQPYINATIIIQLLCVRVHLHIHAVFLAQLTDVLEVAHRVKALHMREDDRESRIAKEPRCLAHAAVRHVAGELHQHCPRFRQ